MISVRETDFPDIKDEWLALEKDGHIPTIFQTYDWLKIWWDHYGDTSKKLLLLVALEGDKLLGIAPLFTDALVLRKKFKIFNTIRLVGSRENTYSGFIVDKNYFPKVYEALFRYISEQYPSHIFYSTDLPEADFLELRPSLHIFRKVLERRDFPCPIINFSQTWEDYWSGLSKTTKKNLKWYKNKLLRDGHLIIELNTNYSSADADDLFRLHYQRWKMEPSKSVLARLEAFERDIMRMLADKGWLKMFFLTYNGRRIAGMFMYDYEGKRYFHKGGYDLTYKDLSPGTVLIFEAIKNAFETGMRSFDFLSGDEPYKSHFTKDRIHCYSFIAAKSYLSPKLFELFLKL